MDPSPNGTALRKRSAAGLLAVEFNHYGNLTLLVTDDVRGLDVPRRDGRCIAAPVIPDTL